MLYSEPRKSVTGYRARRVPSRVVGRNGEPRRESILPVAS